MLTPQEIEAQYQVRLQQQMYEQQLAKFFNPDRDIRLEGIWVAYVWVAPDHTNLATGEWILAGFRRRRNLRKNQTMGRFFSKIRRKLGIDKKAPVKLYDLGTALRLSKSADQSWRFRAPQFQPRKPKMVQLTPVIDRRKRKSRARQRAYIFNPKTTKYIALGRHAGDKRKPGYLYLGPLKSPGKRQAQFEAKRLFPICNELLVLGTTELSKALRAALTRNRRVRAGVTRIQWPEVPPTFDAMWAKFARHLVKREFHDAIAVDDVGLLDTKHELREMWDAQKNPWLTMKWFRKQINSWSATVCDRPRKTKQKSKATTRTATSKRSPKKSSVRRKRSAKRGTRVVRAVLPRLRTLRATLHRL